MGSVGVNRLGDISPMHFEIGIEESPTVEKTQGARLFMSDGNVLYDAASGTFNVSLGGGAQTVIAAASEQLGRAAFVSSQFFQNEAGQLVDQLCKHAPDSITKGKVRDATGSTVNEGAVKAAQKLTGRNGVLSLFMSHHGQSAYTTAISGQACRKRNLPGLPNLDSVKVPAPYCLRCHYKSTYPGCGFHCVEAISEYLRFGGSGNVGCMIVEPVLGNGGNITPPPGYHAALSDFCKDNDIVLIADEVQTGVGRTGAMFASVLMGLKPNIITLAKGLSGIGLPLGAMIYEPDFDVLEPYEHSFTGGGSPVALAAARETIRQVEIPGFLPSVREKGAYLKCRLQETCDAYDFVAEVRGIGLMLGIEIVRPGPAQEPDSDLVERILITALKHQNLVLRSSEYGFGNVVKVRPCLTVTREELDEILTRFAETLKQVATEQGDR